MQGSYTAAAGSLQNLWAGQASGPPACGPPHARMTVIDASMGWACCPAVGQDRPGSAAFGEDRVFRGCAVLLFFFFF